MWVIFKVTLVTAAVAASAHEQRSALRVAPAASKVLASDEITKGLSMGLHVPGVLEPAHGSNEITTSLNLEGKTALRNLLHDLVEVDSQLAVEVDFGVRKGKTESVDEFMPKCLAHVKELVHQVDAAYTDAQLKNVLTQECQLSQEFPHSNPSNFQSHEACLKFADKLTDARMKELDTGKTGQYEEFCKDYYDHAAVKGKQVAQEQKALPVAAVKTEAKAEPAKPAAPKKSAAKQLAVGLTFAVAVAVATC